MKILKGFLKWLIVVLLLGLIVFLYIIIVSKTKSNEVIIFSTIVLGVLVFILLTAAAIRPRKKFNYLKIRNTEKSREFKNMYNYIIQKYGTELEKNRKKLLRSLLICIILLTISAFLIIMWYIYTEQPVVEGLRRIGFVELIILLPGIVYYTFIYTKYNSNYVENFKNRIIKNFIEYLNHNLTYHQEGSKNILEYYLDANFEDESFNTFVTDDYIQGYNEDRSKYTNM